MNIKSILQALAIFVVLIVLLWLAFYVLIFALVIGFVVAAVMMLKQMFDKNGVDVSKFSMQDISSQFSMDDLKNRANAFRDKVQPGNASASTEVIDGECEEVSSDKPTGDAVDADAKKDDDAADDVSSKKAS